MKKWLCSNELWSVSLVYAGILVASSNLSCVALASQLGPSSQDSSTSTESTAPAAGAKGAGSNLRGSQGPTTTGAELKESETSQGASDAPVPSLGGDSTGTLSPKAGIALKDSMRPLPRQNANQGDSPQAVESSKGVLDSSWYRTIASLGAVLCIMYVVGLIIKRFSPTTGLAGAIGPGGKAPSGVVEVLARYPAGKGVMLILLKVDRRVLLISQNQSRASTTMSTLTEFSDATEVASLIAKTATRSLASELEEVTTGTSFRSALGKAGVASITAVSSGSATAGAGSRNSVTRVPVKTQVSAVQATEPYESSPVVASVNDQTGSSNTSLTSNKNPTAILDGEDPVSEMQPRFPREGAARIAKAYKQATPAGATTGVSTVVSQFAEMDGATAATNLRQRLAMMRPTSSQTPGSRPTAVREFEA